MPWRIPQASVLKTQSAPIAVEQGTMGALDSVPYVDAQAGFEIYPPQGWQVNKGLTAYVGVNFFVVQTSKDGIRHAATILVSRTSASGLNLQQYVTGSIQKFNASDHQILDSKQISLGGNPAWLIVIKQKTSTMLLRGETLIYLKNNQAYIVAGSTQDSDWNLYGDVIDKSLLTFKTR